MIWKIRQLLRPVIKKTFPHTIFVRTVLVLQPPPQNLIDKSLIFSDLRRVRLHKLLHPGRQPGPRTAFVAKSGNPRPAVLLDDFICFTIEAHHGRAPFERIGRVFIPLSGKKKIAEIGHYIYG